MTRFKPEKPSKYYKPTEEEEQSIFRTAMIAAWHELQELKNTKLEYRQCVQCWILAFAVAEKSIQDGKRLLLKSHPDCWYVSVHGSSEDVVFEAFMNLHNDSEDDLFIGRLPNVNTYAMQALGDAVASIGYVAEALTRANTDCELYVGAYAKHTLDLLENDRLQQ